MQPPLLSHVRSQVLPPPPGRVSRWWLVVAGAGLVLAAVWLTGWLSQRSDGRAGLPERLRIGFAIEAPYAYLTEDGRVTGESPEIARRVAARLGYGEPEWVLTEFGSLVTQLREGRFDVVASGLFVTAERERLVAFSRPTLSVRPALLVAAGNPRELHSYADVARWGHVRVAVVAGSVEAEMLAGEGVPAERIVLVPDPPSGLALLKSGRVDGLALSRPTVVWLAALPAHAGTLEAAEPFEVSSTLSSARVAHAFRQEDKALRRAWDEALAGFLQGDEHRELLRGLGLADGEGVP
ncbi:MAG: ectoine/hydroxyectoine ABC transporter substrate-binding protein EhuB [Verrucomicrobiota bacterium]